MLHMKLVNTRSGRSRWLVLARIPNEFAKQYMEYYEKQGRDNMEAVDNDLLKDQDKRMPINIDRQSRVLGGTKK